MRNARNRVSATLAAMMLAVTPLTATPALAQTGSGSDYGNGPGDPCNPRVPGNFLCCYYPGEGWFYYYELVGPGCPYTYQAPGEPSDRPADVQTQSPGQ